MITANRFPLKKILLGTCAFILAACASSNNTGGTGGGSSAGSAESVGDGYYRVQRGDNLYRIGLRFGQSVSTLAAWNNLSNTSQIEVGQVLRVGSNTGRAAATARQRNSSRSSTSSAQTAPASNIRLQWPVDGGSNNVIGNYNGTTNKGIDIGGTRGTPVKAAAAGKVLYAGQEVRGYGKLILVSHSNSTLTAYAHNDNISVSKGQSVRAGQTIATMGSSDTDRVKLHFEVRVNGKAVNPMPYLNR